MPGLLVDLDGEPWDIAQQMLEHAGAIPVVGIFADLSNASISVARGNNGEAILYLAMAVPAAGIGVYASVQVVRTSNRAWKIYKAETFDIVLEGSNRARRIDNKTPGIHGGKPYFTYTPVDGRIAKMEGLMPSGPPFKFKSLSDKTKRRLKNEAGMPESEYNEWTIDHGIPRSMGGSNQDVNLLVLRREANAKKSQFENKLRALSEHQGDTVYFVVEPVGGVGRKPDYVMIRYRINDGTLQSVKIPNHAGAKDVKVPASLTKGAGSVLINPGFDAVDVGTAAASVAGAAAGFAASAANNNLHSMGSRSVSLSIGGAVTGASKQQYCADQPHCYWLDIDLHGDFGPGAHRYQCFTVGGWTRSDGTHTSEAWLDATNSASPDRQCLEWIIGPQVYVIVDGVRSNNLTWNPPTADDGGSAEVGPRSVSLSIGGAVTGASKQQYCADQPHCYWLDIDLHGDFGPGAHRYQCFTVGGWTRSDGTHTSEAWLDATNSASPDRQCLEWIIGPQVYVIVDGVRSNNLTWSPPPDF